MARITNGRPDLAVGEPIHFGDIDGFELEHHPISDRLIIRDTSNGTVAYVKGDRGGEIGGDGTLIKALKESKPMADDGRTHDTIQAAERAASSWVFVPPATFNESVEINTEGLTLQGSGYNSVIDGGSSNALLVNSTNVSVLNVSAKNTSNNTADDGSTTISVNEDNFTLQNSAVIDSDDDGINITGTRGATISNSTIEASDDWGINGGMDCVVNGCIFQDGIRGYGIVADKDSIIANNIFSGVGEEESNNALQVSSDNTIVISNRITNSGNDGIRISSENTIVANNRVSDSPNVDIRDGGTNTLLDGNLTGPSN